MKILTNISPTCRTHDTIAHPSIERQVYDMFQDRFVNIGHEIDRDGFILVLDGSRVPLEVTRTGVRLSLLPPHNIRFGEGMYPSLRLPHGQDVSAKITKFCDMVKKIRELEGRATSISIPAAKDIEAFLNEELATKEVEVSYWHDNLFRGREITFFLHPRNEAPADGVLMAFRGANDIAPLNKAQMTEDALGRVKDTRTAVMKARIEASERIMTRIENFDPNKSRDFLRLLEAKKQADELVKEFEAVGKKKRKAER